MRKSSPLASMLMEDLPPPTSGIVGSKENMIGRRASERRGSGKMSSPAWFHCSVQAAFAPSQPVGGLALESLLCRPCCREGRAVELIRDCWAAHEGVVCRGINWERQPLEELADIADCVGGAGLAALCHLLAEDHSGWAGESKPEIRRVRLYMENCRSC